MQGFKSFKDRTVIQFDTGITGIVGPNGCGKSNVVDALFWVMGEQSAKHLRGSSMKDVIFSGSSKYNPAVWAEVSLVLDNTEGKHVHIGAKVVAPTEIQLTRKLYRNGESEYRLNDVPCRLKDIQEVFMDTGAGAKSYSIIAQGEINRLVQAKPDERRMMIEEVAGITKFKMRKRDSLKKIEQTQSNLNRLVDLKIEIEKNLKLLEKQAEKAEHARNLKEKVKKYELVVESHKVYELLKDFREGKQVLNESNLNIQNWTLKKEQLEVSLEEERLKKDDNTAHLDILQTEFNKESKELAGAEERLNYLTKTLTDKESQVTNRKEELSEIEKDFENRSARLSQLEEEKVKLEDRDSDSNDFEFLEEKVDVLKDQLELKESSFSEVEEDLKVLKNKWQEFEQKNFRNNSRMEEYSANLQDITKEIEGLEKQYSNVNTQMSQERELVRSLEKQVEELKREEEKWIKRREDKKTLCKREEEKNKILTKEWIKTESRLNSLVELRDSLEGLKEGSKNILSSKSENFNIVGNLVKCEDKYTKAVQRILGHILDTLVEIKENACEDLVEGSVIDFSKGVDFLSFDKNKVEIEENETIERLKVNGLTNIIALEDVLQIDSGVAEKLLAILKGHYLVEEATLEQFNNLSSNIKFRSISTIDGKFLVRNIGGAKTISTLNPDTLQGAVERNNKIVALGASLGEMRAALQSSEDLLTQLNSEYNEIEIAEEDSRTIYLKTKENYMAKKTSLDFKASNIESGTSRLEILKNRKSEISKSRLTLIEDEEKIKIETQTLKGTIDLKTDLRESLLDSLSTMRVTYAEEREDLIEKQIEAKSFTERIKNFESQLLDIQEQINRLVQKKNANLTIIQNTEKECEALQKELLLLEEKNKECATFLSAKEKHLNHLKDQLSELLLRMQDREDEVKDLFKKISKTEKELVELEIKLGQHLIEEEQVCKNIFDKYRVDLRSTIASHLSFQEEEINWLNNISSIYVQESETGPIKILPVVYEFTRRYGQDLKDAQVKFKEYKVEFSRLGEINWQAIEDYERQKSRFNFLAEQEAELKKSLNDLQIAIAQIDEKSKIRFKVAFEEVNFRFQKVFPIIFGGGFAELRITADLDDPECGVDIVAQPPGKKMQNINLMSGGEKALTAVSLIFSIFLVKPSPFCLLDEVDAPLDDANVGRFNELLREMSHDSQFILITHNKKTMELNDTLYGVTMQEPGVSKAVSVQLH